jgi:hypothetical protein
VGRSNHLDVPIMLPKPTDWVDGIPDVCSRALFDRGQQITTLEASVVCCCLHLPAFALSPLTLRHVSLTPVGG